MADLIHIGARYLRVPRKETLRYWHPERACYIDYEDLQPYLDAGWHVCDANDGYLWRKMPTTLKVREGTPLVPSLPAEIWLQVISQLEYTDLTHAAGTCQHFRAVGQWCMVQRQVCGLSLIREVPIKRTVSLVLFAERWPDYKSQLYALSPISGHQLWHVADFILRREFDRSMLDEIYSDTDLEVRELLWQISPQPSFLEHDMKIGKHPLSLLSRAVNVFITNDDRPPKHLTDSEIDSLHTLIKELYQSCWYYFKRNGDNINPREFGKHDYYRLVNSVISSMPDLVNIETYRGSRSKTINYAAY